MFAITKSSLQSKATNCLSKSPILVRQMGTHVQAARKEGDISSVFVSLSGVTPDPLPQRFADIKRQLIQGSESAVTASWKRLLEQLAVENQIVKQKGPDIIPSIQFRDLQNPCQDFISDIKKRGVAAIRGVVPEDEARGYKNEVEDYVKLNPWTKGNITSSWTSCLTYLLTITSIPRQRPPSLRALLVTPPSPRSRPPKHALRPNIPNEHLACQRQERTHLHLPTAHLRRPRPHPETRRQQIRTRAPR